MDLLHVLLPVLLLYMDASWGLVGGCKAFEAVIQLLLSVYKPGQL